MKYEFSENILMISAPHKFEKMTVGEFFDFYRQSSASRYHLLTQGGFMLDNSIVKNESEPIGQREIRLNFEPQDTDHVPADNPCRVSYEDPFLYLAHKDAGYIIHGEPDDTDCLMARAARYQIEHDIHTPVRPIHRLDKDTSGLVLFSKNTFFQPWLDDQLQMKKIERNYLAICRGSFAKGRKQTISAPLGRDRHRSGCYRISKTGKSAVTHIEGLAEKNGYSLIRCTLETGRTHQIRVHLSSLGLPIVNDPLYGIHSSDFSGMGLWAYAITFRNPLTNKKHRITDEMNPDYTYFGGLKL